jgi:tyrosinase
MKHSTLRVRRSLIELQKEYDNGIKKPLEDLMRAWKGIKELPTDDLKSFFKLGGFHGEPFRGAGWGNSAYWGGYCNHGNVLFPTWHRVYLIKIEEALQSIKGCEHVMLPFWDETDEYSTTHGVPWPLTREFFELDGKKIPNPLRSFVFPQNITDHISGDDPNYSKPRGYETVRYPLSGLVGSATEIEATKKHNDQYPDYKKNVKLMDQNVMNWLNSFIVINDKLMSTSITQKFKDCLLVPNYTLFSNTTSAAQWNSERQLVDPATGKPYTSEIDPATGKPYDNDPYKIVVPLESPHNSIHLAIGGCDVPGYDASPIEGANGDMGENDTAGLDPIFYFHHCNVDRVFWIWQKKHGFTNHLEIIPEYPGTNTVDNQGPTPGFAPNTWLTLESPLEPFKKTEGGNTYTSLDCINIERQLGFTYGPGSLDETDKRMFLQEKKDYETKVIKVSGINKAPIVGSFLVSAFVTVDGKKLHLGTEAVLSRWHSQFCANCQTHLEVKAFFELPLIEGKLLQSLKDNDYKNVEVEIKGRDVVKNKLLQADEKPAIPFRMEIV